MKPSPVKYGGTRHGVPEGRLSSQFSCSSKKFQDNKREKYPYLYISLPQHTISENTEAMWEYKTD